MKVSSIEAIQVSPILKLEGSEFTEKLVALPRLTLKNVSSQKAELTDDIMQWWSNLPSFKIVSTRLEKEGCSAVSGLSLLFVSVFGTAFTGPALLKVKE